jgi:hypothetical protein
MKLVSIAFLIATLAVTGCGKKDKDEGGGEGAAKTAGGGGGSDKAAAAGPVELAKLGLEADAPAGSKVGDGPLGDGAMVQGPDLVVAVEEASDMTPADVAAAKQDADMYSPAKWTEVPVDNGYLVTFENTGGMGTNYWVKSRLDIGGKAYTCDTTASSAVQQANAVAFCKSLRAAQ